MTHVLDMTTRTSEMLIHHAQDLTGGPVARIHIPHLPNTGFHGNWIPDEEIERANA
jgi:carotenoid cleavage dioxygenase